MALEVIGDFAVVWLLSPTRSFTPTAKSSLARYINALPGHALQVTLHTNAITVMIVITTALILAVTIIVKVRSIVKGDHNHSLSHKPRHS